MMMMKTFQTNNNNNNNNNSKNLSNMLMIVSATMLLLLFPVQNSLFCEGYLAPSSLRQLKLTTTTMQRQQQQQQQQQRMIFQPLYSDRFNRDIEERSRQRAQGEGGGEMAAGAILGGLLGGPFGVLFGAQIGASLGGQNALKRARKEEMDRLGITQDMLDTAEECGLALQQSIEGLKATRESLNTQQSLARSYDREAQDLYERAKAAMVAGDEEMARTLLLKRNDSQEKLKKVLIRCAEEKKRLETMEKNVEIIERRALEVEALMQRTVGSKARQDSLPNADIDVFSMPAEDPLLKKFRDAGIE